MNIILKYYVGTVPPRGPSSASTYSQIQGSSGSSGMPVGGYPPTAYGMPPHVNAPPSAPPPGVYPGVPRDHPGTTVVPNTSGVGPSHSSHYPSHGPPPPSTAAAYNYHNSGYYPGGPPPHPPPSNYHQGSSRY